MRTKRRFMATGEDRFKRYLGRVIDKQKRKKKQYSVITSICPKCSRNLVVRKNKKTGKKFLGCSGYPRCKETQKYRKIENLN